MERSDAVVATLTGRGIPLRGNDIDTDRIIPARYLKLLTWEDLGRYSFYDERFDDQGREKDHPLNDRRFRDHDILLVERNFGCGSSREHAPQSLMRWGIRAFIGISFAGIFAGNCVANGMPAVSVSEEDMAKVMNAVEKNPSMDITIDLHARTVAAGGDTYSLSMPESHRNSLVAGTWDSTATLLASLDEIEKKAAELPYLGDFSCSL